MPGNSNGLFSTTSSLDTATGTGKGTNTGTGTGTGTGTTKGKGDARRNRGRGSRHIISHSITPLYSLIQNYDWKAAVARLKRHPKEAKEWYVRRCNDGSIQQKFLPIHTACRLSGEVVKRCEIEASSSSLAGGNDNKSFVDELIQLLIAIYPDGTKLTDVNGMLPIHWAAWGRASSSVFEMLLYARKESASKVDVYNRLPLHIVCDHGAVEEQVVTLLRKHYAGSVGCKDIYGRTPIEIARQRGHDSLTVALKRESLVGNQLSSVTNGGGSSGTLNGQQQMRRATDTTTRTSITSAELSNLPELDRVAKRASERARRASIGASAAQVARENSFTVAAAVVANSNEHDAFDKIMIDNNNGISSLQSQTWKPNLALSAITDDHSNSIGLNDEDKLFYEPVAQPKRTPIPNLDDDQDESTHSLGHLEFARASLRADGVGEIIDTDYIGHDKLSKKQQNSFRGGGTTLCRLILSKQWDAAIKYLRTGHKDEAEEWRRFHSKDGSVHWRLPIHDACIYQPTLQVIEALVDAFRAGPACKDDLNKLPIHWACEFGASEEVVEYLLKYQPLCIFEEDIFKQTPLNCAYRSEFPNKEVIAASLLMEPSSRPMRLVEPSDRMSNRQTWEAGNYWEHSQTNTKSYSSSERTLKAGNAGSLSAHDRAFSISESSRSSEESYFAKSTDGSMAKLNLYRSTSEEKSNAELIKKYDLPVISFTNSSGDFSTKSNRIDFEEPAQQLSPNVPGPQNEKASSLLMIFKTRRKYFRNIWVKSSGIVTSIISNIQKKSQNHQIPHVTRTMSDDEESTKNDEETVSTPSPYGYITESVLVDEAEYFHCISRKSVMFLGLFFVISGMAITAIGVSALSTKKHVEDNLDPSSLWFNSMAPSLAPSSAPGILQYSEFMNMVSNVTNLDTLFDKSSPQYRALQWMIEEDNLQFIPTSENFLQRYALATLYFSFDGPGWENQLNWLNTTVHECEWNKRKDYITQGVSGCSKDKFVTSITIRKF